MLEMSEAGDMRIFNVCVMCVYLKTHIGPMLVCQSDERRLTFPMLCAQSVSSPHRRRRRRQTPKRDDIHKPEVELSE